MSDITNVSENPISTSAFMLTLDDVLEEANIYITVENNNKNALQNLDYELLKANVFVWAKQGFPDSYPIYKFTVTPPQNSSQLIRCSDGALRNIWDYIPFFLGSSIQELIDSIHAKVDGFTLAYSVEENPYKPYTMVLHATRSS